MKKIIFLSNTFYPEYGAAPNRLLHTALGLQNAGYKIEVITGIPHYPKGRFYNNYERKFYQKQNYQGIDIHRFWLYPSHSDGLIDRFLTMFSLAISVIFMLPFFTKKKPDYLFLQYPPIAMILPTLLLKKLTKAKLIVNVSDLWPLAIEELGFTKQRSIPYKLMKYLERVTYNNATLLLAQSNEIKAYLEATVSVSKVILYRTAVDSSQFKPKPKTEDYKHIKIIYAGVLGIAHGMASICKQLDLKDKQVSLHIYGDGFEKAQIKNYIKQEKSANIFLYDMLPQAQLIQELNSADIILVAQKTRIYGTVPSKTYDAMAMGKPILFHGAGEGAEIIRQIGCGFISKPNDFEKLNQNLSTLISSPPAFRQKLGQKGRLAAKEKFDRKIYLKNLINALEKLELNKLNTSNQESYAKSNFF